MCHEVSESGRGVWPDYGRAIRYCEIRKAGIMVTYTEEQTTRWMLKCNNPDCERDFLYRENDPLHPMQVVNNSEVPAKPKMPAHGEPEVCPHCNTLSQYRRLDLRFDRSPKA